jgi:putative ABC transport system permease protein
MTFFTIVVCGLIRHPVRTGLTLLGISIGIAAVVTLVGLSRAPFTAVLVSHIYALT